MTKEKEFEEHFERAKASLEIEGLHVNEKQKALLKEKYDGRITRAEYIARAKELADHE